VGHGGIVVFDDTVDMSAQAVELTVDGFPIAEPPGTPVRPSMVVRTQSREAGQAAPQTPARLRTPRSWRWWRCYAGTEADFGGASTKITRIEEPRSG